MTKPFVPVVTEGMLEAAFDFADSIPPSDYGKIREPEPQEYLAVMAAHPDFQRQVLAYAVEVGKGGVPEKVDPNKGDMVLRVGWNAAIDAALANLTALLNKEQQA